MDPRHNEPPPEIKYIPQDKLTACHQQQYAKHSEYLTSNGQLPYEYIEPGRIIAHVLNDIVILGIVTQQLYFADGLGRCFRSASAFSVILSHEQVKSVSEGRTNYNGLDRCYMSIDDLATPKLYVLRYAMSANPDSKNSPNTVTLPEHVLKQAQAVVPLLKKWVNSETRVVCTPYDRFRKSTESYNPSVKLPGFFIDSEQDAIRLENRRERAKRLELKRRGVQTTLAAPSHQKKTVAARNTASSRAKRATSSTSITVPTPAFKRRKNRQPEHTIDREAVAIRYEKEEFRECLQTITKTSHSMIYECSLENDQSGNSLVMKQYLTDRRNKELRRRAFINEVNLMFRHCRANPRLVNFVGYIYKNDFGEDFWSIIMNRYDLSLKQYLKHRETCNQPRVSQRVAIRIALHISEALKFLHEARVPVYHRDIKPGNILLNDGAHGIEAYVCDLGISCEVTDRRRMKLTEGTAVYMSPEALDSELPNDIKGDIYSFGSVLFEMLSGRRPWLGKTASRDILEKMRKGKLPGDTSLIANKSLASLVKQCWTYEPKHRPTAAAIVEKLRAFMNSEEVYNDNLQTIISHLTKSYDTSNTKHAVRGGVQNLTDQERDSIREYLVPNLRSLLETYFTKEQIQLFRDGVVTQRYIQAISDIKSLTHKELRKRKRDKQMLYLMYHTKTQKGYVGQTEGRFQSRICQHMDAYDNYHEALKNYEKDTGRRRPPREPTLVDKTIGTTNVYDWICLPLCQYNTKIDGNALEVLLIKLLNTCHNGGLGMGYNVSTGGSFDSTKCVQDWMAVQH